MIRLTNPAELLPAAIGRGERPYGVGDGEGDGEGLASLFLVASFLVVVVDSFFVASVDVSFLVDFLVVADSFFAGDFSGAVVVLVSVLLVQALMSPAANITVME